MEKLIIREITINAIEPLVAIAKKTFIETYSSVNSEENMRKYLQNRLSVAKIKAELLCNDSMFYFAEFNNEVVGYLKVNVGSSQTELKENNALEIERIYVLKAFHGKKVGQLLCRKAIEIAQENQISYVWLGVWEENPRALRFYEKNGFVAFDKHIFKLGDDEQTDIMMKLAIKNDL